MRVPVRTAQSVIHVSYHQQIRLWRISKTRLGKGISLDMWLKFSFTVKPVLSGHSKIDQTKVLMTNGSLMKVESIAAFCNTFDLH